MGVDAQKNLVGNGQLRDQVEQTFRNLQTALASVDATLEDILKLTIYVVNYQHKNAGIIGEVLRQYFQAGQLPAMSLIGVQALAEERFLVEVEAEAVVSTESRFDRA